MKSTVKLSAITILAVLALVGCNQNGTGNSTDSSATNSNAGMTATNLPATNSMPDMSTNMPASTNH